VRSITQRAIETQHLAENSHMVKLVVFNVFPIVGSRLCMFWGITLKVYEYGIF